MRVLIGSESSRAIKKYNKPTFQDKNSGIEDVPDSKIFGHDVTMTESLYKSSTQQRS